MWQKPQNTYRAAIVQWLWIIVALWVAYLVDRMVFERRLRLLGIYPGNWSHWEGIFLSPFIHKNVGHILGNSIGLMVLGSMVLIRGWSDLVLATLFSILSAGVVILIFGSPNSLHYGASGVVYGYFGFLVALGFYEKSAIAISIALVVIILFWTMIGGMFPTEKVIADDISWLGHLGGAIGGVIAAQTKVQSFPRRR